MSNCAMLIYFMRTYTWRPKQYKLLYVVLVPKWNHAILRFDEHEHTNARSGRKAQYGIHFYSRKFDDLSLYL